MRRSLVFGVLVIVAVIIGVTVFTRPAITGNKVCCGTTTQSCTVCCDSDKPVWKNDGTNEGWGSCWKSGECPIDGKGICYPCSSTLCD